MRPSPSARLHLFRTASRRSGGLALVVLLPCLLALTACGPFSLWSFGFNGNGELGEGTTTNRLSPVAVDAPWRMVAAGFQHSVALRDDGTVWAWGDNGAGALGDGTTTNRSTPTQIGS